VSPWASRPTRPPPAKRRCLGRECPFFHACFRTAGVLTSLLSQAWHSTPRSKFDCMEAELFGCARQSSSVDYLLPAVRVIDQAMETAEQKDSRGARTGDCPCSLMSAGLKQFEKAIYDDVVDQTSSRARAVGTRLQPEGDTRSSDSTGSDTPKGFRCLREEMHRFSNEENPTCVISRACKNLVWCDMLRSSWRGSSTQARNK
jgi:hypothetical protein